MKTTSNCAVAACVALALTVIHCSNDTSTPAPATTTTNPTEPAPAPASGTSTLTVMNFLNWCSVSINGGAASTGSTVTANVDQGTMATIVATPASDAFQIGSNPWLGVDSSTESGSGATETTTATVTIGTNGDQCVSVCCQLPGNAPTPCPTTNPCGQ